ncbi:MAG: helix-turn-helix transcriptional regulator [Planctomycetota bacterium]
MNYAKATRLVRAARGISQSELATRAKCSPSSISLIESGDRQPSLAMAKSLAQALKVPFDLFTVLSADSTDTCDMPPADAEYIGRRILSLLVEAEAR